MIATVLLVLATWFVLSAAATYVWVKWRMRCQDRRTFQQVLRDRDDDLDAELRHLIEQNRT